jgi:mono/diheme cytochrome c family protein
VANYQKIILSICASSAALLSCSVEPETATGFSPEEHSRIAFGGRLFDMWYDDIDTDFVPDDPETVAVDGSGGPNGNGTLNDAYGDLVANNGHDYRFKNLLGWDMRGAAGIYGTDYQNKSYILSGGPLSALYEEVGREEWIEHMKNGFGRLPAYGDVLSDEQVASLVDYMLAVRDRRLPHPDDLYTLATDAPKGFILQPGGNAQRGHALYEEKCADCHGADATKILFDDGEQTLGMHARYYGYAIAMITLAGEPGSEMGPQLSPELSTTEQTQTLLDLLAALCDRNQYPRGAASDPEIPDNDLRCGEYLR